MSLKLYNQLSKKIDIFKPQSGGDNVTLYTCGPTVYDYPHIGNWSGYIYWDVLVRVLEANHLNVTRVMNITDVGHLVSDSDEGEDKLEKGARREGKAAWDVADFYTKDFLEGMDELNLVAPTHITKATDYIDEQLELVKALKDRGFTYQIDDGIYFDTSKFPTYDDFAGLNLAAQKAGARVEYNPEKRNPSDFALWKFTPETEKRDMEWKTPSYLLEDDSEEKMGFPGWHLECSAMAMSVLGNTIDIHTGGIDHIPVHHTNEIAQSEAATGQLFSRFWLHNNHLKVDGTKISKSLQNSITLSDLKKNGFNPLDFKMLILQSHYKSEGNFTFEDLKSAQSRRHNWLNVAALRHQMHQTVDTPDEKVSFYATSQALVEALSSDIDTPAAFKLIDETFSRALNTPLDKIDRHAFVGLLQTIDDLLGLQLIKSSPDIDDEVKQLILQRERAREDKDYKRSDNVREDIEKAGISVRDTSSGSVWEYK